MAHEQWCCGEPEIAIVMAHADIGTLAYVRRAVAVPRLAQMSEVQCRPHRSDGQHARLAHHQGVAFTTDRRAPSTTADACTSD